MMRLQHARSAFAVRPLLFISFIALLTGSLLGAHALTADHNGDKEAAAPPETPRKLAGPIVMGTVDSSSPMISYMLPPVLQSGTVTRIHVRDGAQVHAGNELYEFDTSPLKSSLKVAKSAVAVAETKVEAAKQAVRQQAEKVKLLELAVIMAKEARDLKLQAIDITKSNLERGYKFEKDLPQSEWESRLEKEEKYFLAKVAYTTAINDLKLKEHELAEVKEVESKQAAIMVEQAEAGVKQAEAEVAKAQNAIDLCTMRAKIDGTVEQISISEGSTLGVGTMKPALWLIPAGPRVVRAEIEAEFAHRVSKDLEGKIVTIYDNNDPKLTYKGKVGHISGTFLVKRSANEGLLASDTRVLEAEVIVLDDAPKDRPPLRVGQRVRVDLGQ